MLDYLVDVISEKVKLTESEIALCNAYFEKGYSPKHNILEMQDKVPQYLFFITSGYMRLYYTDEKGFEITTRISSPKDFITSFLSFINGKPSKENLECITDCEFLRISKTKLASLIKESEHFREFSLIIFEQAVASTASRANDLATLNAEQRYKKLLSNHPDILQHVPIQYIASYLGMKPESLSRIRRTVSGKK